MDTVLKETDVKEVKIKKEVDVKLTEKVSYDGFMKVYEDQDGNTFIKPELDITPEKCHLSAKDNVVISATGQGGKQIGITKHGDRIMYTGNILVYTDDKTVANYGLSHKQKQGSAKKDPKELGFTAK